jgi:hypothetical protein
MPKPGAAAMIHSLRVAGHSIVIYTARNMGSTGHNVGLALKNTGKMTFDWLERHGIEYDEIFFGKPNADVIIDDRAVRFVSWDKISEGLLRREARDK